VWLSKDNSGKTAWQNAARGSHVEILEKLWDIAAKTRGDKESGLVVKR